MCFIRFGNSLSLRSSYPEVATANYTWVNDIKCNGTESNITECNITTEAEWDYCSGAAASVICGK